MTNNLGFNLAQYRQLLGHALGFYWTSGAAMPSMGNTSTAIPLDANGDAAFADTDLESTFLDGVYALFGYTALGGTWHTRQVRVKEGGLAPANGTVTFTSIIQTGGQPLTTLELSGVLPVIQSMGRRGLHDCINLALNECWMIQHYLITGVTNQYQYSFGSAVGWLYQEEQIVDVWVRRSGAVRDQLVEEWRLVNDMDGPALEFKAPFTSSDTIKVVLYRPLDSWVKASLLDFANSTTGLVADTDAAMLSLKGMLIVGLVHCYETLASIGDESERAGWRQLASRQRIMANVWKRNNLPHETGRDHHWKNSARSLVPQFPLEGSLS